MEKCKGCGTKSMDLRSVNAQGSVLRYCKNCELAYYLNIIDTEPKLYLAEKLIAQTFHNDRSSETKNIIKNLSNRHEIASITIGLNFQRIRDIYPKLEEEIGKKKK